MKFYLYLPEVLTGEIINKMTSAGAKIDVIYYIDGRHWVILEAEEPIIRLKTYAAVGAKLFNGEWVVGNGLNCHCGVNSTIAVG